MFLYIIIYFAIFIVALTDTKPRLLYQSRKALFCFMSIVFFMLSFLRWECGTDWYSYYNTFTNNYSIEDFKNQSFELLFSYLNLVVKSISDDYTILLIVIASIIFPLKYSTLWKYSPYPFISLLLYYLMYLCDIFFVRETIALAIVFYSIRYIIERKLLLFFLLVGIASQFHLSSIIFIFAYPVYYYPISRKSIAIFLLVSVLGIIMSHLILIYLGTYLGGNFAWKIDYYLENGKETYGTGISVSETVLRGMINRIVFVAIYLITYLRNRNNNIVQGLIKLYFFSISIFAITCPLSVALARVCRSYEQVSIILIGYYLFSVKNKKVTVLLLSLYFFIRFYMGTLTGGYAQEYIPYKTVFSL